MLRDLGHFFVSLISSAVFLQAVLLVNDQAVLFPDTVATTIQKLTKLPVNIQLPVLNISVHYHADTV
jgi:hypothetical protein